MKLRFTLLVALMLVIGSNILLAQSNESWKLNFGKKADQIGYYNEKSAKNFAEDAAFGPMSFRINKGFLWLLDSIRGRLLCFNQKNVMVKEISVPGLPKNSVLEDFAFETGKTERFEAFWVAEAAEGTIRKVSLPSGKEMARIGGLGNEPGKFIQIHQVETDLTGRLYVGDYGRSKICVFTPYGKLVREMDWQMTDFALDRKNRLYNLHYLPDSGYYLQVFSPEGTLLKNTHLGFKDLQNARILKAEENGGVKICFIPATGFKGTLKLIEVNNFGATIRQQEFVPPKAMNRFIFDDSQAIWLAAADFYAAPNGKFEIKKIGWGGY